VRALFADPGPSCGLDRFRPSDIGLSFVACQRIEDGGSAGTGGAGYESFVTGGGTLDFTLGTTPNRSFGSASANAPLSLKA